jgi:hypothetical protein
VAGGDFAWLPLAVTTAGCMIGGGCKAQWTTNMVGTLDGSGAFSNALPVNTSEAARFFWLRTP